MDKSTMLAYINHVRHAPNICVSYVHCGKMRFLFGQFLKIHKNPWEKQIDDRRIDLSFH